LRILTNAIYAAIVGAWIIVVAINWRIGATVQLITFVHRAGIVIITRNGEMEALRVDALVNGACIVIITVGWCKLTNAAHAGIIGA
jgi:hypothetical protein